MTSFGPLELLIIIAIAALLFGAPIVTFLLGYGLGQRRAAAEKPPTRGADTGADAPEEGASPDE